MAEYSKNYLSQLDSKFEVSDLSERCACALSKRPLSRHTYDLFVLCSLLVSFTDLRQVTEYLSMVLFRLPTDLI